MITLFLISAAIRIESGRDLIRALLHPEIAAVPIDLQDPESTIVSVKPAAASAGIQKGDILRQVNGQEYRGMSDLYAPVVAAHAGDPIRLQVERQSASGSALIDAAVTLPPNLKAAPDTRLWIQTVVVSLLMPAVCFCLGFWVAAVRIRDPHAWLLLFVLLGFAQQSGTAISTLYGHVSWFQPVLIAYHHAMSNGWPIAMMLFGLYFPVRLSYDLRRPWLKWFVIGPLSVHLILNTVIRVSQAWHALSVVPLNNALDPLDRPLFALGLIAISFFFFGTATKMGMTASPDARRHLSLLLWGAVFSLTSVFLIILKDFAVNQPRFENSPEWLILIVLVPLFFFPVTLAYLIVVQRAMDVRVVVRQSVQYLLATALLMASLRASLRGQTIRREGDLAVLMSNVNKLLYESSTSNRYAGNRDDPEACAWLRYS